MSNFSDKHLLTIAQQDTESFLYKKIIKSGTLLSFRVLTESSFRINNLQLNKINPIDTDWSKSVLTKSTIVGRRNEGSTI